MESWVYGPVRSTLERGGKQKRESGEGNKQHIYPKPQHIYVPRPLYEKYLVPMTRSPLCSHPVVAKETLCDAGSLRGLVDALTILHFVFICRFALLHRLVAVCDFVWSDLHLRVGRLNCFVFCVP